MNVFGFTDETNSIIKVEIDGLEVFVPNDMANRDRQMLAEWEKAGNKIMPYAEPAPTVVDYQNAIQALVDQTAVEKLFNDGVTLASYVTSTIEPWAQQAQAFVAWRDNVWQYSYSELAKVEAGARSQPTIDEFLAELPKIVWPVA